MAYEFYMRVKSADYQKLIKQHDLLAKENAELKAEIAKLTAKKTEAKVEPETKVETKAETKKGGNK